MKRTVHLLISTAALVVASIALFLVLIERSKSRSLEEEVLHCLESLQATVLWRTEADPPHSLPADFAKRLSNYVPESEPESLISDIKSASVVLMTRTEQREGRLYQVVSRIFTIDPKAEIHYEVGHPLRHSDALRAFGRKPEGTLSFCSGSPAVVSRISHIYGGRLASYSDLPLSVALRLLERGRWIEQD